MPPPTIFTDAAALRSRLAAHRAEGRRVGVVPTMGALHAGHVSLVEAAKRECESVVTTIFVNPTQFGPGEDYERYPRDLENDAKLLEQAGCDLIFSPPTDAMYPGGCETSIDVGSVARPLEGEHRPRHFAGVATVVLKLFNLVPADVAFFGRKDYQQSLVICRMVTDLNVPIEIQVCPTVREHDGLAMSSRNAYLTPEERERALAISGGLNTAKQLYDQGERNAERLRGVVAARMQQADLRMDYVAVVREGTVEQVRSLEGPAVVLAAARVGKTRLIDNQALH